MSKVIAICGKIASGKTYHARRIMKENGAILLSEDEVLKDLFPEQSPKDRGETTKRIEGYLLKKAAEIVKEGCDVILDWGFWKKQERASVTHYYQSRNISIEWHYIETSDEIWIEHIRKRNNIKDHEGSFFLDIEILKRVAEQFEIPDKSEQVIKYLQNN